MSQDQVRLNFFIKVSFIICLAKKTPDNNPEHEYQKK